MYSRDVQTLEQAGILQSNIQPEVVSGFQPFEFLE